MKKKDEISAEDLLDQLRKHIDEPGIVPGSKESSDNTENRPKTLEELFGHQFIRRGSNPASHAVVKAQPIHPAKKQDVENVLDPTKVRIDETQYDLRAIFGMNTEAEPEVAQQPSSPAKVNANDPYDHLSSKQKKAFASSYRRQMKKQRISIFLFFLLSVMALFWENADFFGLADMLPSFLNGRQYPISAGWMALQLMLFAALLFPEAFRLTKEKNSSANPSLIFLTVWVLHIVYLFIRIFFFSRSPMLSFSLPVLFAGLLAKLYAYGVTKREYLAFCVAFSNKDKYTLRLLDEEGSSLERQVLKDYMPEGSRYFAVEKIRSVQGFCREMKTRGSVKRPIRLLIPGAIFISICFGIVWWSISHSLDQAVAVGMGATLVTMPFSLFYVFYAPTTSLASVAFQSGSAVIGERAMDEYASPAVVTFRDSEVFPPERVRLVGVKVFEHFDLSKAIGYASAIFCATGGALGDMFSSVVSDTGYTADMDFITVSENGIEAAVDGELVRMGNRTFLKDEGVTVPSDERDLETDDAVLYMAIGKDAVARIEIEYEMDEDFENIARNLFRSGICVAIKTFDPNINRAFLERRIRWGSDMPLKIIRGKEKKDCILRRESAESLLLSASQRGLFETVKYCRTTRNLMQIGVILAGLSMLAAIPIYWIVLKLVGFHQVTSLNLLVYQLIWLLPMLVITKLFG